MKNFLIIFFLLMAAPLMGATFQTFDDGMGNITWSNDGGVSSCGACMPTKNGQNTINFYNKLEKGNYLMVIRNNGKTYKEKLIVQ